MPHLSAGEATRLIDAAATVFGPDQQPEPGGGAELALAVVGLVPSRLAPQARPGLSSFSQPAAGKSSSGLVFLAERERREALVSLNEQLRSSLFPKQCQAVMELVVVSVQVG